MEERPKAIFICGPIAAGKSHSLEYFKRCGYDTGAIIQADVLYRAMLETNTKMGLDKETAEKLADKGSMQQRDSMVQMCIDNKKSFSLENTMSEHCFAKMKTAKEAGFDVVVHVTFQKSVDMHIDSERRRRLNTTEVGAHFANNKQAEEAIKYTYNSCLKGLERAAEHATSMKVYVNYMNREPEFNKPVIAAQMHEGKNNGKIEVHQSAGARGNKDLNEILDKLDLKLQNEHDKVKIVDINDWNKKKEKEIKTELTVKFEAPKEKKKKGMSM